MKTNKLKLPEIGFIRTTSVLFFITLGLKILGLLREVLMAAYIGMNQATDAYNIAVLTTSLVTGVSGIAIGSSLIPVLAGIASSKGEEERERFFSNVFWAMMILAFIVAIILYIFAVPIIRRIAPGFDEYTVNQSARLFQIGFIKVNAIVASTLFTQYLNYKKIFYMPMIGTSIGAIALVGYYLVVRESANVEGLMIMTVISYLIEVVWQFAALIKSGFSFRFYWNLKETNLMLFFSLAMPAVINYGFQQIGIVVNRALASQLTAGSITALNYANSIVMMINMTVSLSIATVIYPPLAESLSKANFEKAVEALRKSILLAGALLIPATMGIIILAEPISMVIFERGVFTAENSSMTAIALMGYAMGIFAYALYELSNRFFNSLKDTRTPMKAAFIGVAVMIILSLVLYKPLKLYGLALANSLMQVIMAMVLLVIINNRFIKVFDLTLKLNLLKVLLSTAVMSLVLLYLRNKTITLLFSGAVDMFIKVLIAIVVYAVCIAILSGRKMKNAN